MERRCPLSPDFWGKPLLGTVCTILSDRGCKFYRGCHCGAVPPVYAGNCHGVLRSHDHNRQRIRGRYGAASPAAADHNPHVGHVPLFPDGCRRMERHWGRHADARRPLWRWKGRLYSGIPHGSHDDLLCQDWRRVECGGTDPRSGRTGQADQHL